MLEYTFKKSGKDMKVTDKKEATHYLWGNNRDSWVLVDTEGLSVKQESMPVNTRENLHFHSKAQQFFYILKGTATFYFDTMRIVVEEQKGLLIEPETKHYISNETRDRLDFLVISQPTTRCDRTILE
jgi:mannose-6-phosphate isomerase-like protein (cupin superfamily)